MIIYIAILAVCISTCEFGYTKPMQDKAKCEEAIKKGISDMPPEVKPFVSGTCIPVNIDSFI